MVERILKTGLYRVVPVRCTEDTCISYGICGDYVGDIGLRDDENESPVICHDYRNPQHMCGMDRKVTWVRK